MLVASPGFPQGKTSLRGLTKVHAWLPSPHIISVENPEVNENKGVVSIVVNFRIFYALRTNTNTMLIDLGCSKRDPVISAAIAGVFFTASLHLP